MKQIKKQMVLVLLFTLVGCGGNHGGDDDSDIDAPPVDIDAPPDAPKSYAPCEGCCDPINQTGCAAGQACYQRVTGPVGSKPTYCDTAGATPWGEHCFMDTDCASGTSCMNQTCTKFCVTDAECAPLEDDCFPVQNPFIYGVCS